MALILAELLGVFVSAVGLALILYSFNTARTFDGGQHAEMAEQDRLQIEILQ
jgi:hypothetical protein